jgi:anthranilate phosphoribosyltransferase
MRRRCAASSACARSSIFWVRSPIPAGAANQLVGVFHPDLVGIHVRVLQRLGSRRALVVYGKDGMDEVSLGAATMVGELKDGEVRSTRSIRRTSACT